MAAPTLEEIAMGKAMLAESNGLPDIGNPVVRRGGLASVNPAMANTQNTPQIDNTNVMTTHPPFDPNSTATNTNAIAGGIKPLTAYGSSAVDQSIADVNNYNIAKDKAYQDSFMGQASPYIKGASGIASTVGSLANIYVGFKQLDIQKEQLAMAKDQWAEQKKELNHIRGVRTKLNAQYMA